MKLSTRARYGIHAMYDLAFYGRQGPQPLKAIAQRQKVPEAYLEQLMGPLRRAGLVKAVRGAQGGYLLAKPPGQITVEQVLEALEGEVKLADCLLEEAACDKACVCPTRLVWQKLRDGIHQVLEGITLEDMLRDYARLSGETLQGIEGENPHE